MTDWSSVPTFGVTAGRFPIQDRPSAYATIPNAAAQLAVVRTDAGYFLPGGGIEGRESAADAVLREVTEECGLTVVLTTWRAFATEVVCSEAEWRIVDRCVQIMGSRGVTGESAVMRIFTDMRAFLIYDGPNEVHRWSMARKLSSQRGGA